MELRRPWKVNYQYPGTKISLDPGESTGWCVLDPSRPIVGMSSHSELKSARRAARSVSRNGGSASVLYRDDVEGSITLRTYQPYEVLLNEWAESL
jgi:hypothetical protein